MFIYIYVYSILYNGLFHSYCRYTIDTSLLRQDTFSTMKRDFLFLYFRYVTSSVRYTYIYIFFSLRYKKLFTLSGYGGRRDVNFTQ